MNTDRRIRLWSRVVACAGGETVVVEHVCAAAMSVVGVDGVAVSVVLGTGARETVYASDRVALELAELALTLGEGPGVDAVAGGPVLVADLTGSDFLARWPMFVPAAASTGVAAVFAFPLHVGAVRVGVMDLYRTWPGSLAGEGLADALVLADTACILLLDAAQLDQPALDGRRPAQDGHAPVLDGHRSELVGLAHPEVHQATGMLTVQLGVSATVALIRLRAYAYAHNRRLRDVAGDVVARRLRFHPDGEGGGGQGGG